MRCAPATSVVFVDVAGYESIVASGLFHSGCEAAFQTAVAVRVEGSVTVCYGYDESGNDN
jgi:hypothetical protein